MNIHKPGPEELPSQHQLLLATAVAIVLIAFLLVIVVLPAERGIDPTGIGKRLHLTRMGQIKVAMAEEVAPVDGRPSRQDETIVTIPANQGMEIKLEMKKGFTVEYSWAVTDGTVAHDTHGDPYVNADIYISYSKADSIKSDSGRIEAVYSGYHGWYWKNNNADPVTINLKTHGEYFELRPM